MRASRVVVFVSVVTAAVVSGCGKSKDSGDPRAGRTTEAEVELRKIFSAAKVYFETNGGVLVGDSGQTPFEMACQGGQSTKHTPTAERWTAPIWNELAFQLYDPHFYSYQYIGTPTGFTALATGDIDCDGTVATFSMSAGVTGGALTEAAISRGKPGE